jgi:hypothetical protein
VDLLEHGLAGVRARDMPLWISPAGIFLASVDALVPNTLAARAARAAAELVGAGGAHAPAALDVRNSAQ